jgi:hypothetical protein
MGRLLFGPFCWIRFPMAWQNREDRRMITAILQMAVLLACAFAFAGYLLHLDKQEKRDARQSEIDFSTHAHSEDHKHRGAAMSRL